MADVTVSAETTYPASAPGARVRVASYVPYLAEHGVDLRYRPTLSDEEYGRFQSTRNPARKVATLATAATRLAGHRNRDDADLRLVFRARFVAPLPGLEPTRAVDAYDFDDALFVGSIFPTHRRYRWLKNEVARHRAYLRRARLVIAGNSHLASHARQVARRVEVIPSCVEPDAQPVREHVSRDVLTVGWIGSRSTSRYLNDVLPVFAELNAKGLQTKLVAVGASSSFAAPWLEYRPWSLSTQHRDLASFDIGIMPMPDNEWTRGKCGYKLLQYFAAGVPAIASPVGVNSTFVGTERGMLAGTRDGWMRALVELAGDVEARRQMGATARTFVERDYSYRRWAPELASLLREL
jgi:glycosyltransferase involved in cell wall biosynthesis